MELGKKAYGQNLLILLALTALMLYVNGALFAYGTNFMFLTRPPVEGLPILNLDHGWYVYFLALTILALALMTPPYKTPRQTAIYHSAKSSQ